MVRYSSTWKSGVEEINQEPRTHKLRPVQRPETKLS